MFLVHQTCNWTKKSACSPQEDLVKCEIKGIRLLYNFLSITGLLTTKKQRF